MILQALCEYYERSLADPERKVPPEGWEWKGIHFLIVVDTEGNFIRVEDTRELSGKKLVAKKFLVPSLGESKGSAIKANLFWENAEYFLGVPTKENSKPERVKKQHQAFIERMKSFFEKEKIGEPAKNVLNVFSKNLLDELSKSSVWDDLKKPESLMTFKIEGLGVITDLPEIRKAQVVDEKGLPEGICLVTGEKAPIKQLHPPILGVKGANSTGASLVSVNNKVENGRNGGPTPAFASFLKQQGFNAPVSVRAALAYTRALNLLLDPASKNKTNLGETTIVFWAQKEDPAYCNLEQSFSWLVGEDPKDDPDRSVAAVKALYESVFSGRIPATEQDRFYVLGLSPNAGRISVRLWRSGKARDFADKIIKHFEDVQIIHGPNEKEHLPLSRLLKATALDYTMDNVPPNLPGAVLASILDGTPYPRSLLQQCIRRIRAERKVTRERAGILKACINRQQANSREKEVLKVSLDRSNPNVAYRLGRLFAVLEKIQEEANPGINATIRDRYYGAASSMPVVVFPQLLKLKNYHMAKLTNPGRKVNLEKEIGEIMDGIATMPSTMSLDQQAHFAVGYYHQMQAFYNKNKGE
ncbi:CRISPR-associated protein Cas8c/Csd1, subtype I-C/DVULG [Thermanaerovibrio velox DSM 12556]|uniref:CRISPR-associated protein Cas8c/Csd1, subtype I-C/DVULG n=1 Tax=Thermanaerovibrio velox DSM 12556 TaxID=926567 RepID=H0UPX0_9BACT|nr:type I-C CRISPR-associated protein Cas8c/Csd1 [Thermanaerovibrio velox]EHM10679.1 CRISPR-associated protein Cas8c/Csd1, subtype I-C/DVULG [Thermanaerovibrio velox DSM 12556]